MPRGYEKLYGGKRGFNDIRVALDAIRMIKERGLFWDDAAAWKVKLLRLHACEICAIATTAVFQTSPCEFVSDSEWARSETGHLRRLCPKGRT